MEDFFGPDGILKQRLPNFEYRQQQEELAEKIDAFLHGGNSLLAAEAPTGVGKTYAMLIPAMLWAQEYNSSVLVLTSGITLQEQLMNKDIPALLNILGMDLPYSLLKGRANYACIRLAQEISSEGFLAFEGDKGAASHKIGEWLYETETGDLSELGLSDNHPARARIASSYLTCLGGFCPHRDRCFYTKALINAMRSRIIVANYHVFFSYVLGQKKPFPIPCGLLLCDEAHKMADAARSATQVTASASDLHRILRRIPKLDTISDGIIAGTGFNGKSFVQEVAELSIASETVFEQFSTMLPEGRGFNSFPEKLKGSASELLAKCAKLLSDIDTLEAEIPFQEVNHDNGDNPISTWYNELSNCRNALRWCCDVDNYPEWAYWRDGKTLKSSCVSCSSIVPSAFGNDGSDIKTVALSATMTVDGSFEFWSNETGLIPDETILLDSPFDLKNQMKIYIVNLGVKVMEPDYADVVARACRKFVLRNKGATLVLLSSRKVLNVVSEYFKEHSEEDNLNVLAQGDLPRSELLKQFKENERSVLLGMASFREGIDVPGEALTQVIIDKIPFSHPGDPVGEARRKLEGSKNFMHVALPSAKMQLRQAVGRLIRTSTDKGKIVILDNRVCSQPNWKILDSLPKVPHVNFRITGWKRD